ncbi:PAS domain-containing protein [Hoeflea sp. G2-23]|uniref:PAS domain-containing protein n=1 Tax=Hoeflea algicola TaxID=2983763 RepID=A0ABT3Z8I1_9HYPH|nr:PAS domain-containing protein [Hoeflea algicola]MCY0148089.1 PAS domain-containing protein [Hoeflea algicola]
MVRFEFSETTSPKQDLDHIGLTDFEIAGLMSYQHQIGYWRSDMGTGHVFWSKAIFDIYGMAYTKGPVNLTLANDAVHPEDLPYMLELLERTAVEKTGFHYVLRLKNGHNGFKYVRSVGRFRLTEDGREELYGMFEEVVDQVRLVGVVGNPTLAGGIAKR